MAKLTNLSKKIHENRTTKNMKMVEINNNIISSDCQSLLIVQEPKCIVYR